MRTHWMAGVGLLSFAALAVAGDQNAGQTTVDLGCVEHGQQLVQRIQQEQVVVLNDLQADRIRQISMELCQGAEKTASEQQEAVLRNWFFSDQTGGKAGNERLKRLK